MALEESKKALPNCRPNPPVGCVVVRRGEVIAKGFTQPPGQHHAEAMALASLESPLDHVTVFVTLEPCSFHGRTPSCARLLVERGIKKVFVAMLDPHPKNRGAGIDILNEAGVETDVGLLEAEVKEFLEPYLIRAPLKL